MGVHVMGMAKRHMEEVEGLRADALGILEKVGCIEPCPIHSDVMLEKDDDLTDAYKLANSMITNGEIELPHGETRRGFTDLIKDVFDDNRADECYSCAKNLAD